MVLANLDVLSLILRIHIDPEKERTSSCRLSSDLYIHAVTYAYSHLYIREMPKCKNCNQLDYKFKYTMKLAG